MSRSGYSDDLENWEIIKWRGMVTSAIRGKRGQKLLKDILEALDAMPEKVLISDELQTDEGDVCTLGAVGVVRGLDLQKFDIDEPEEIAGALDIAPCLAQEIMYMNDEWGWPNETPQERWQRMRSWVEKQILKNEIEK